MCVAYLLYLSAIRIRNVTLFDRGIDAVDIAVFATLIVCYTSIFPRSQQRSFPVLTR